MELNSTNSCCTLGEFGYFFKGKTLNEVIEDIADEEFGQIDSEYKAIAKTKWKNFYLPLIKSSSKKSGNVVIAALMENTQAYMCSVLERHKWTKVRKWQSKDNPKEHIILYINQAGREC